MVAGTDLTGNVALITGAGRGVGRAVAVRMAEAGTAVVVCMLASDLADYATGSTYYVDGGLARFTPPV